MCLKGEHALDNATDIIHDVSDKKIPKEIIEYAEKYERDKGEKIQTLVSIWTYSRKCDEIFLRTFAFKNKGNEKKIFEVMRTAERIQAYRNVYYTNMGGWHVAFVGDASKHWYYGYGTHFDLWDWECRTKRFVTAMFGKILNSYEVQNIMEIKYPYLLKKYPEALKLQPIEFFKLISQYKQSSSIEWLLEKGMKNIALDKRINTMTKEKKTSLVKFLLSKSDEELTKLDKEGLTVILGLIKHKLTIKEYKRMVDLKGKSKKDLDYFNKMGFEDAWDSNYRRYRDYIEMCEKNGHNIKESYWRYPKDINAAHNRMMDENKFIEKSENMAKFGSGLEEIYGEMSKATEMSNGKYRIYIPTSYEDYQKQVDVLYQCLIRNGYIEKTLKKEFVIVFIRDMNDKPIATAEVHWEFQVGQFYADERDRKKCIPSEELKTLLDSWINENKSKIKKPKAEARQHYFKGFKEELKDMFGKIKYEVGKVYDTGVKDEDFNVKCKSSERAFHFCRDIKQVNHFIDAKYICEIEPLGQVLHVGEEYFSNRIRVVRIIENYNATA